MSGRCDGTTDAIKGLLDKSYGAYTISFHQHSVTAHAHEYTTNTGRQPLSCGAHLGPTGQHTAARTARHHRSHTACYGGSAVTGHPGHHMRAQEHAPGPTIARYPAGLRLSARMRRRCDAVREPPPTPPTPLSLPRSSLQGRRRSPPPLLMLEEEVGAPPPTQWSIQAAPERSHGSDRQHTHTYVRIVHTERGALSEAGGRRARLARVAVPLGHLLCASGRRAASTTTVASRAVAVLPAPRRALSTSNAGGRTRGWRFAAGFAAAPPPRGRRSQSTPAAPHSSSSSSSLSTI